MKRVPVWALVMGACLVVAAWVLLRRPPTATRASQSAPSLAEAGTIAIGTETWPGYLALYVARDLGYFREAGLTVNILRYVALGELSKDYVAGKMQGRANLTFDAVNEARQGLDHKIVLAIDYSNGSDAIIANQAIASLADVKGQRVGLEPDTLEEFIMAWALREHGLSLSDVTVVPGGPGETTKQLQAGAIDVAVTHEPFLSQFLASNEARLIYSSADAPGLITDVLTFRTDFLRAHPQAVEAIVRVYFKALRFWAEHPEQACAIVAKEFQDTPEGIARQLQGIRMLDESGNRTAFTFSAGLQSLYGNLRQVAAFLAEHHGPAVGSFDSDALVDRTFIKALAP